MNENKNCVTLLLEYSKPYQLMSGKNVSNSLKIGITEHSARV